MVDKGSIALWIGFALAAVGLAILVIWRILDERKKKKNAAGVTTGDAVWITFPVTMDFFGGKSPGSGKSIGTKVNVTLNGTVATPQTAAGEVSVNWTSLLSDGAGQKAIASSVAGPTGWNTHLCGIDKAHSFSSVYFGTSTTNPEAWKGICITPSSTADMRNFLAARVWPPSVGIQAARLTKMGETPTSGQTTAESAQGVFDTYQIGTSGCSMSGHPMRKAPMNYGMNLIGQERMTSSGCDQGLITVSDDTNDGCYPVEWAEKPLKTGNQIKYRNIPQSTYWEASQSMGALPSYTLTL
jgi:hypothetical protein